MDNKIAFGVLTILFNSIGVPSFMTGNTKRGILSIVFGVITFGIIAFINAIKGIIAGIKILQMSDEEFAAADKASLVNAIPAPKAE